jgi:hypothetical protein
MNESRMCPICGNNMKVYNTWWCPYCEKPEPETIKVFNLIKCIDHLVAKNLSAGKTHDELMTIVNDSYNFVNDSYFLFCPIEDEDRGEYTDEYELFNDMITSNYDVGDGCLFEVSW